MIENEKKQSLNNTIEECYKVLEKYKDKNEDLKKAYENIKALKEERNI